MGAVTPNFGIRYPFVLDGVTCADFQNFALDVEAALATVDTARDNALNRPFVEVDTSGAAPQTIAVTTLATINMGRVVYDTGGMASLPGGVVIVEPGVYMAIADASAYTGATTMTSEDLIITQNGNFVVRRRWPGSAVISWDKLVIGSFLCAAGDVINVQYIWTGTGGPMTRQGTTRLAMRYICAA